jgi:hypothetical protein
MRVFHRKAFLKIIQIDLIHIFAIIFIKLCVQDFEQNSTGVNVEQMPEQKENTSIPSFGIIYAITGLLGVFLCKRR